MSDYILQITIWIVSYFFIGKSGYLEEEAITSKTKKETPKTKIYLLRMCVFLLLSLMLNGLTNLFTVTILPAFGILGLNYYCDEKTKGKPGLFTLFIFTQMVMVVFAFIYQDIFKVNYYDLIYNAKADKELIFKLFSVIVCLTPTNLIIKVVIDKFILNNSGKEKLNDKTKSKDKIEDTKKDSLLRAGRLIGNIERILTLGLLFADKYEAIGFLLAAKSIIRTRERKADSEYILIGTLLSFGIAILIGLSVQHLIKL